MKLMGIKIVSLEIRLTIPLKIDYSLSMIILLKSNDLDYMKIDAKYSKKIMNSPRNL